MNFTTPDVTSFWFWYTLGNFGVLVFVSFRLLPQVIKFQKLKKKSVAESKEKGAYGPPEIIREMSEDEVKSYNQTLKKNLHNAASGFLLSLVLTNFLLVTFIQTKETYSLLTEIIVLPELLFFSWWFIKNYNGYIEKKRPVCCIRGSFQLESDIVKTMTIKKTTKKVEQITFLVRSIRFTLSSYLNDNGEPETDIMRTLKSVQSGDVITVEYTLLLNQVLQIQKT